MLRLAVVTAVLLAALGCTASAAERFPRGTALIKTGKQTVSLKVEIAETPDHRSLGLMNRRSLPRNAGMVFVFERPENGSFWMKNTLIPLSIAFYNGKGKILRILDMEPCREDPCPLYSPNVTYKGALEVNRGAFRRLGVARGDVIRVRRARA
jgi:uncharacterized membrane protein (UPF0127 family)